MATFGDTVYSWAQPSESQLNEAWGSETNRATAVIKLHLAPGGSPPAGAATIRRKAIQDLLEYPTLLTDVTSGISYINRHLPLAYGAPFHPSDVGDAVDSGFWANKFLSGEGKGPYGQEVGNHLDTQAGPIPVYRYYQFMTEFTDRTYDMLPDSAVLAPGPLAQPVANSATAVNFVGLFGVNPLVLPANYDFVVTALSPDGETTPSGAVVVAITQPFQAVLVNWTPVAGATGYNIYGHLAPGGTVYLIVTVTGSPDGAGNLQTLLPFPWGFEKTPPVSNTTAGPLWSVAGSVGFPDEGYWLAQGNGRVGGRYITRLDEAGGYAQTIPAAFLQYASGGAIPTGRMQVIPEVNRKLTWHMCPRNAIPVQAIISQLGTLNAQPFDGWPAGTLLFESVEPRRYRDPLLNRVIDLTYVLVGKPNVNRFGVALGHNAALKFSPALPGVPPNLALPAGIPPTPAMVDYDLLFSGPAGTGNAPYRMSNFSNLFRAPQS